MYRYNEIKAVSFEITSRCQAQCPMCARNYHGGIENPLLPINDIDLVFFKNICPESFIQQLQYITICGNFGDPIMNKDLISIIDYIVSINPTIGISIDTNGSARNTSWWINLAKSLPENHIVQFGIDGLEDTHSLYRIGTNFKTIIDNAKSFIGAGGKARWNFITFKHNEHQLEQARALAKELQFDSFREKQTSRFIARRDFDVLDKDGNILYKLEQPTEQKILFIDKETLDNYKTVLAGAIIHCEVEKTKTIHINAQGYLWPCSFTAGVPYIYSKPKEPIYNYVTDARLNFKKFLDENFDGIENFNLKKNTIEKIINSETWQTVWDRAFVNNSVHVCTRTCGKFEYNDISQCRDQFLDLQDFNE